MYPIIGIISRKSVSETGKNIDIVYQDIFSSITKSKGIPIGIPSNNILPYLSICKGFVLQGGDDIDDDNIKNIKILREKNIPVLGICLGMQEMAYLANGIIYDIPNHQNNIYHEVSLDEDSFLYKIVETSKILVNSRHKSAVKDTDLFVSSYSKDGIIESVEDKNLKFFVGLQWHPENMYNTDISSRKIFDYFVKVCND